MLNLYFFTFTVPAAVPCPKGSRGRNKKEKGRQVGEGKKTSKAEPGRKRRMGGWGKKEGNEGGRGVNCAVEGWSSIWCPASDTEVMSEIVGFHVHLKFSRSGQPLASDNDST